MDEVNSKPHLKNIMVVDDDDSIREAMRTALEYEGYTVSKKWAEIPIVVVSAFGDQAQDIRAKKVYKKSVNLKALFGAIKQWCSKEAMAHG